MKFHELENKTKEELESLLDKINFELLKYRAQATSGALGKDSGKIKALKKDIARIKTALNKGGAK